MFLCRSSLARIHGNVLQISLLSRQLECGDSISDDDLAVEFEIPSGPLGKFLEGQDSPMSLRLRGAKGIDQIGSGHATVRLSSIPQQKGGLVEGELAFQFRTAHDEHAPFYASSGTFRAVLCEIEPATASFVEPSSWSDSIAGTVNSHQKSFPSVQVYLHPDGYGGKMLTVKAYPSPTPCHTISNTVPYLFTDEIGPGPRSDYYVGRFIPVRWFVQDKKDSSSERTLSSTAGAGWLLLDEVSTKPGAKVRGRMVTRRDDSDAPFSLAGRFEAVVCGVPVTAW